MPDRQIVGNAGMYYVAYRLSRLEWNAMPTSRNARGVDIVIYNRDATIKKTIQVKTLSNYAPIPLGKSVEGLIADFIIICVLAETMPSTYIMTTKEMLELEEIQRQLPNAAEKGLWAANSKPLWETFASVSKEKWDKIGRGA
jgi:hypothetical protein